MPRQIPEAVVGCVFEHFRKRRKIENEIDEAVDCFSQLEHHQSHVNQLGSTFADDVHTQEFPILSAKDKLQQPGHISGHSGTGIIGVMGATDLAVDPLLAAALVCFADRRDLGNCVHAYGELRGHALLVCDSECVASSHAPLLHGGGSKSRKADDIAGGINCRDGSLIERVDLKIAALVELQSGFLEG